MMHEEYHVTRAPYVLLLLHSAGVRRTSSIDHRSSWQHGFGRTVVRYSLHPPDARNRSTKIVAAKVSESGGMLYSLSRESTCSSLTVDSKPPELLVPVSITRVLLLLILVISVISAIYTYSGMRTLQPHPSQLYVRRQEELASSTAA